MRKQIAPYLLRNHKRITWISCVLITVVALLPTFEHYGLIYRNRRNSDVILFSVQHWQFGIILALLINLTMALVLFYAKIRNENLNLTSARTQYSTKSKIKIHDIRNNYNTINNLVTSGQYELLKIYTDKSASYLALLLNNWSNPKWTVSDEIKLLTAYADAEEVLKGDIDLVVVSDLNLNQILFMPDVLTTFLQNSIRHKRSGENLIFQISIETFTAGKEQFLYFDICDNAIPSNVSSYFDDSRPNRGLHILRSRIHNESYLKAAKKMNYYHDELKAIPLENGTQIIFSFPYELSS